ncbi:hypothetical protein BQ8794_110039 [Mesorhizobium prunaredense]|uniref:Uncharacterized protein n=1 Tax=Mesorhizobium prunaredense TaxID=1631249 RepID=A0A1R3V4C6_9HYPH|nr:hypothetical protein BQ8794_110039 [Mesorhizobium prunaredense]
MFAEPTSALSRAGHAALRLMSQQLRLDPTRRALTQIKERGAVSDRHEVSRNLHAAYRQCDALRRCCARWSAQSVLHRFVCMQRRKA